MSYVLAVRRWFSTQKHERRLSQILRSQPLPVSRAEKPHPYSVAVIGAGAQGRDQCFGLKTLRSVQLTALADQKSEAVEKLSQELGLPGLRCYHDPRELLRKEKPDLLCIATNTVSHLDVAHWAVEAGISRLIVEKPVGNNVAKARKLALKCAEQGVKAAINHTRRWSADYAAIKRAMDYGFIGQLRHIYMAPGPGGFAMTGSHYFDLFNQFGGSSPAWLTGFLEPESKPNNRGAQFTDPGGYCVMVLKNGVKGYLNVSDDLSRRDGFVVLRGDAGRIEIDERAQEWYIFNNIFGRKTLPFLEPLNLAAFFAKAASEILSEASPSCGFHEGITSLEMVMAAHLSHARGNRPVDLPLDQEGSDLEIAFP